MKTRILSVFLILLFISACNNTFEVGIEHSPTGTLEQVTNPAEVQKPAATPVSVPMATIPAATAGQVKPAVPSAGQMVKIFVIAVDDNGQAGIPVVGVSETMPDGAGGYVGWQLAQLNTLEAALGGGK